MFCHRDGGDTGGFGRGKRRTNVYFFGGVTGSFWRMLAEGEGLAMSNELGVTHWSSNSM